MKSGINPRSRWEIIYDVLKAASEDGRLNKGKARKTHIMQGAYLDWRNFQRHFDFLLEQGFIAGPDKENYYYLTEKGRDLLEQLEKLKDIIQSPTQTSNNLFRG